MSKDYQICDQCQEDIDIKNMRYFPSDTHICIYCINPGFNVIKELSKCQNAYNELCEKSKWISVKDRLPDLKCRVLVNHYSIGVITAYRHYEYSFTCSENWDCPIQEITHWMSLPEAPHE